MPALLFHLRNVPQEEADGVRALLEEHGIESHETSAGQWGIALPAIWLNDEADLPRARSLINDYQREHSASQRKAYESALQNGELPTLKQRILAQPLKSAGIILFCLFILYAMISPFMRMISHTQ